MYGIDSSAINKQGALERSRKVKKYFGHQQQKQQPTVDGQSHSIVHPPPSTTTETVPSQDDTSTGPMSEDNTDMEDGAGASSIGFFKPLTHLINPDVDIFSLLLENDSCGCHKSSLKGSNGCKDMDCVLKPSILTGLHSCGDLTPLGLQQFVRNDLIRGLVMVGCCYHHITEEGNLLGACTYGIMTIHWSFMYRGFTWISNE